MFQQNASAPLILASGSQVRLKLLTQAGIAARVIKSGVDEEAAKAGLRADAVPPRDQAMALAEFKAAKVSMMEQGLVIGCDQMLSLGDAVFDKPKDMVAAADHLTRLSGRTHTLETAICIADGGQVVWRFMAQPKLTMRDLSSDFIRRYLTACGEDILSTVGGYQLENLGSQLFDQIEGDYFSILGLPLLPLLGYLRVRGLLEG